MRNTDAEFSQMANGWKKEGWREKGMWRFLGDFGKAVEEKGKA